MKIYKVIACFYDFWFSMDRGGIKVEEHYFTTEEKAKKWIDEHKTFCYGRYDHEAKKSYEMPEFSTKEIEVH